MYRVLRRETGFDDMLAQVGNLPTDVFALFVEYKRYQIEGRVSLIGAEIA